jgi:glutathione-regulated potassium-efflux system protein KefB
MTFLLAQAGEFGFVLFGSALVLEVIDESIFVMAVGVISLSMLLTPLLVQFGNALANRLEDQAKTSPGDQREVLDTKAEQSILIGGYGRVGHTIATLFESSGIPFIAFDVDPKRVAQGRAYGHPVLYGDISDPELLAATHAEQASLAVLTISDTPTALLTVSHLRNLYPQVPIIARARDLEACARLLEAGATHAYPEALEASLRLAAEALQMVGAPADNAELLLQGVRDKGYELIREEPENDEKH